MRSFFTTLLAAGAAAALATGAHAQGQPQGGPRPVGCQLQMQPTLHRWELRSDGLTGQPVSGQFEIAYVNTGAALCEADLILDLQGERYGLAGAGQARAPYDLTDMSNGADITPRSGSTVRSQRGETIQVPPGERLVRHYLFLAHPGPAKGDGAYEQLVLFQVQDPRGQPLGSQHITLALDLTPTALMGLKGAFQRTPSGARIDLGELSAGARDLMVQLYVMSSRGYRVSVASQNQGELRITSGGAWAVPYDLTVGPHAINLRTGDSFQVTTPGAHDDSYPLGVVIGEVDGKRAGSYTDLVTFTVAAI